VLLSSHSTLSEQSVLISSIRPVKLTDCYFQTICPCFLMISIVFTYHIIWVKLATIHTIYIKLCCLLFCSKTSKNKLWMSSSVINSAYLYYSVERSYINASSNSMFVLLAIIFNVFLRTVASPRNPGLTARRDLSSYPFFYYLLFVQRERERGEWWIVSILVHRHAVRSNNERKKWTFSFSYLLCRSLAPTTASHLTCRPPCAPGQEHQEISLFF